MVEAELYFCNIKAPKHVLLDALGDIVNIFRPNTVFQLPLDNCCVLFPTLTLDDPVDALLKPPDKNVFIGAIESFIYILIRIDIRNT